MSYGIYVSSNPGRTNFAGCESVCAVRGCGEIAIKYYIRGEDQEFEGMYEKSHYAKLDSWIRDRIYVLGFCDYHSSEQMQSSDETAEAE